MKLKRYQKLSILFLIIAVVLSILAYVLSNFNKSVFSVVILVVFSSLYILSYNLQDWLYEKGESALKYDKELVKLEKDDLIYHLAFLNGAGFAFLIPGLLDSKLIFSAVGLVFLTIGNLIYILAYLPRQNFLIIKRKTELDLQKNGKRR